MTPAERFGSAFRSARTRRGMTNTEVRMRLGVSDNAVSRWATGQRLPHHERAVGLAEMLDAPHLARLSIELRGRTCVICERAFIDMSARLHGRCCSPACRARYGDQGNAAKAARTRVRGELARRRLTIHQEAVTAFCRACEPEGLCRTSTCELRPVSPLPLADERLRVA